jgi:hypothetical protein
MLAKLIAVAVLAVVDYVSFFNWPYRVAGKLSLAANERRYVCAPFEGYIYKVNVQPGDPVKKGDVLFELNTFQLRDQLAEAQARRDQAEKERMMYKNDKDTLTSIKAPKEAEASIAAISDAAQRNERQGKRSRHRQADIDGGSGHGRTATSRRARSSWATSSWSSASPTTSMPSCVAENDIRTCGQHADGRRRDEQHATERITVRSVGSSDHRSGRQRTIYKVRVQVDKNSPAGSRDAGADRQDGSRDGRQRSHRRRSASSHLGLDPRPWIGSAAVEQSAVCSVLQVNG